MFQFRHFRLIPLAALLASCSALTAEPKGNAATGKELFTSRICSTCHAVAKDESAKLGPSLVGVVGRKAGAAQGMLPASEALKKFGATWNAKTLDEFLADPQVKVPGSAMSAATADRQERADIIAYLASLK